MRVLLLSDGRAGHDRSSLGILAALSKHRPVEADVLPIVETRRFSRRLKRALAGFMPFDPFWRAFYRVGEAAFASDALSPLGAIPVAPVDLLISTGPRTAPASIALARRLRAKNVYFGSPRWPSDRFFTLILTTEQRPRGRNFAYTLRPSEIDAAKLPDARPLAADGVARHASLLFGGPLKHNPYTIADMELLADRLVALTRELPWLKWKLFDSRRTPREGFDRLAGRVADCGVDVVRFSEQGLTSNNAAYSSDLVLVTADSMSMLTESVVARRPTGILFTDAFKPPKRDATEQAALIVDRRAFPVTFSGLSATSLLSGAAGLDLLPGSQLDTLYETLVDHGI